MCQLDRGQIEKSIHILLTHTHTHTHKQPDRNRKRGWSEKQGIQKVQKKLNKQKNKRINSKK